MKKKHWALIITLSLVTGIVIQSFHGMSLSSIDIPRIIGNVIGLIGITYAVAGIFAIIYWLFKRKSVPRFNILVWGIWAIVAIMSTMGNYNISTYASSNQKVISEDDAEYMIKGIDVDSGTLNPGTPQNETQSILSSGMKDFDQLNIETRKKIARIGAFEISNFAELKSKPDVSRLKENLKIYKSIKNDYYDSKDILLQKYRKKINPESELSGRLEGTSEYYIEKLEVKYIDDLNEFYEFILNHHESVDFSENQIIMEDNSLVNNLNTLWGNAIKSATDLTTSQEKLKQLMSKSIKEFQDKNNDK